MEPTSYLRFVERVLRETRPFGAHAGGGIIKQERGKVLQQWWWNTKIPARGDTPHSKNGEWRDVEVSKEE